MVEHLLAENVWPLIWLLALVALILVIATFATGRGKYLTWVWALAVLALVLLAVEWLWVTDRERVEMIVDSLAQAVRMEDSAEIERFLSPECRYGNMDRAGIRRLADSIFDTIEIDKLTISGRKTQVFPLRKEATSEFLAVVRGRQSNVEFSPYPTRWILTFAQNSSGDWEVIDIQQIPAFGEGRQPIAPPGRNSLP